MDVRNRMPLAELIGSYDPTKQALFLEAWRQHVYAVNRFTNAVRTNDERSQEIHRGELYGVMSDMAELLVKLSPNMNRAAVEEALHWHADQVMAAIVAQNAEAVDHRYVASIAMARKSQVLAGVLEEALLAQFPERIAVEDTIYDLVRTWNSGNVDAYMGFWTDGAIEQIAARTGMGTAATLRRHFRRALGVPPETYRRTFRERGEPAAVPEVLRR
jgi:AraC-like DNA-binding protein